MENRLIINPLVEENMNQMVDSEFAISQITGHVDLRRESQFISKTKELGCLTTDINEYKKDVLDKVKTDLTKEQEIKDLIAQLIVLLDAIKKKLDEIEAKLKVYEKKAEDTYVKLNEMDKLAMDILYRYQTQYFEHMNATYELIGQLMVQIELLDRIKDNKGYFTNFVKSYFKYYDRNHVVQDYGTISQHSKNWDDTNNRVYKTDYDNAKTTILNAFTNAKNWYNAQAGRKVTGDYRF